MFKASFPRHARLGNVARRQLSTFSSFRPLRIQSLEQNQLSAARLTLRPSHLSALVPRFYSSEAVAEQRNDDVKSGSEHVTKFADMSRLGVHERLVSAITEGMGYEDMTDVQSSTINAALRGTDLYVYDITIKSGSMLTTTDTASLKPRLVPERL